MVELLPEECSAYIQLGIFLREKERLDESLEVLRDGQEFMGSVRPNMNVVREIGLTLRALGQKDEAIDSLKAYLDFFAGQGDFNFHPLAALPLAELYEEKEEFERAADIFRHLAKGSHTKGHFTYNAESARLLEKTGDKKLARKYFTRALEIAPDEAAKEKIQEKINAL